MRWSYTTEKEVGEAWVSYTHTPKPCKLWCVEKKRKREVYERKREKRGGYGKG